IALEAGFERPESFSRAFRNAFGQSPLEFRKSPEWNPWQQIINPLYRQEKLSMKRNHENEEVRIVDFPETPVAMLEHRGDPGRIHETLRTFIAWRKQYGPSPAVSRTYNLVHDDPSTTSPNDYRFGICASIEGDVEENEYGVTRDAIPAGRCAVLRHRGSDRNIGESVCRLYADWLPASGEEARDFPIFFHRVT